MVQVGLALLVSDEVQNVMRRLQLDIARACGGNPALRLTPHVTLKQPFHVRALDAAEAYFDALTATVELEPVRLRTIGYFDADPKEGVAYLDVEPHPQLEQLRMRILAELYERFRVKPQDVEGDEYHFHATLAYHLTGEQLACAREALAGAELDLAFQPARLALFYYTGDLWIVYKVAAPDGSGA